MRHLLTRALAALGLPALLCLALPGCASMPAPPTNAAAPAPLSTRILADIDRAEAAYQRARPAIDALIAALPAERQVQARATLATVDYWIAQARLATSAAAAVYALRQAAGAMAAASAER